jgi:pimeloyl-ACP methyl ester carboxylesterase
VIVPGRGEFFLRDTGGDGPVVLLLHGWAVTADLNWHAAYEPLAQAGYRVLALDHRGHGRGLRALEPFRLSDCAADAAAVLRALDAAPATIVGYSMGGAIAQLVVRDHRDVVSGVVLSATSQHFQDRRSMRAWRMMGLFGLAIATAPRLALRLAFRLQGLALTDRTAWWFSELLRNQAGDVAEAGRELGRFDSRPWLSTVSVPAQFVLTSADTDVPPARQRELAAAIGAPISEAPINHLEVTNRAADYNPILVAAIARLGAQVGAAAA